MKALLVDLDTMAALCHEANRQYCTRVMKDDSQVAWENAPIWQKESARNGIIAAMQGMTPEQLHHNWMQEKIGTGWVYGEKKSESRKTHPCIVPYTELPKEQKQKDTLFHALVNAFLTDVTEDTLSSPVR